MKHKVSIIGASGAVGREMVKEIEQGFDPSQVDLTLFASPRSAGQTLECWGQSFLVQAFDLKSFSGAELILMSAGSSFSLEYSAALVEKGCTVIDNSSAWRRDPSVALVVPEINPHKISPSPQLIANPNCSTIQMLLSLHPIRQSFGLKKIIVSTYQSVSGTGQKGIDALESQMRAYPDCAPAGCYPQPIINNLFSSIDVPVEEGYCNEEKKMIFETRKIFEDEDIFVLPTTVRVPVLRGHSESVSFETKVVTDCDSLLAALKKEPYLKVYDQSLPTLLDLGSDLSKVHVSRLRPAWNSIDRHWFSFWNMADNLKVGAATNAVRILREKLKRMT